MEFEPLLRQYCQHVHPLPESDFEAFARSFRSVRFARNEFILQEGQVQRQLYFVLEGVQMSYSETDDKEHVLAFTYPPSFTGIPESFFTQKPSRYALKALTDTHLYGIAYEQLQTLFDESRALERLFRKSTELIFEGFIHRYVELQTLSMEARFLAFAKRSPHLFQIVPHKHIASYLRIDATNFSKLYNRIKI